MRRARTAAIGAAFALAGCGRGTTASTSIADASVDASVDGDRDGPPVSDGGSAVTTCRTPGARAAATLQPVGAPVAPDAGPSDAGQTAPIVGTASFVTTAGGVDLVVSITGCQAIGYPVVLHEGSDCSDAGLASPVWDSPRGSNIADVRCAGTSGVGVLDFTRASSDPEPWTVGGPSTSSVVGHALVVHDPATMQPLACGVVQALADADAGPAVDAAVSASLLAELSGLCTFRMLLDLAPDASCASSAEVAACACEHCDLAACLPACGDYVSCLRAQPDACTSACSPEGACGDCLRAENQCMEGFCLEKLACPAPLVPGGPCAVLEACCASQRDGGAACFAGVSQLEKYGGDPSCAAAMHDWDFLTNGPNDPPCNFDQ